MLDREGLLRRSTLLQAIRRFFREQGYLEVDTPVRLPVLIPESNIDPVGSGDWFLQTSPELCMKRLLARGAEQLFQICHCFRAGEQGRLHQPEFTMLEWYRVGWEYRDLMQECEQFLHHLVGSLPEFPGIAEGGLRRRGRRVCMQLPWSRLGVEEAFAHYASMSVWDALGRGCYEEVLVEEIEPHLGWEKPVFLMDYPVELASLARKKRSAPHLAERFELYICGMELANGFSELVDAQEQRQRFLAVQAGMPGRTALPELFLKDLERLKETAGIALGVDRLCMLLLAAEDIASVVPFAQKEL